MHAIARRLDPAFMQDPYPTYRAWREAGPVHWSPEFFEGAWLLTHHADVERALRDPRLSAQRTGGWVMQDDAARRELGGLQRLFARAMLFLDAPDHLRLRRVLAPAFRPAALQRLAQRIERKVDELLDGVDAGAGFDFMEALARPLPAWAIATMLGIDDPPACFVQGSDDLAAFIGAPRPSRAQAQRAEASLLAMARYFEGVLARRRGDDGDDLVALLLKAESAGEVASGAELLAQCAMLLFAGHETTRNLLGNGLAALLAHRAQWERLAANAALAPQAVRELLRYDSPVQYTGRRVAADMELHGQRLRRGELVVAVIGAANRDPARHARPDELDVERPQAGLPLSFGTGPHVCIGAPLSLMEAEIVLRALVRRWPGLALMDGRVTWNGNAVYRGPVRLRVRDEGQRSNVK